MKKHDFPSMLVYILSAELCGALSALFSGGFSMTYKSPPLMPPAWIFPAVWVILYAVMGYSAYLVSRADKSEIIRKSALGIYWTQLAVNFSWSIFFFRFGALWLSVGVILLLLALIIVMIREFCKADRTAALINIPYLLWVIFASYLNIAAAVING